jgi:hypothetical protein
MNIHTALRHERNSAQHARNIAESEMWWNPPVQDAAVWAAPLIEEPPLTKEELIIREHQNHVERVPLLVPYWLKCVNAAARGVELRMEPFLESLQEASQSWVKKDPNPWGDAAWGWGEAEDAGRWGVHPDNKSSSDSIHSGSRTMSTRTGRPRTGSMRGIADGDAYAFVEDIALQEAADAERKRRMHSFFEVCAPPVFLTFSVKY